MEGLKYDEGKTRWDLIPELASMEIANVFTAGAKKYGDNNWHAGIKYSRLWAAARRHVNAFLLGEEIDEIGTHHLANAIVNLMMMLEFELEERGEIEGLDDLSVRVERTPTSLP